ncbi:hypothetical protein SCFA_120001 [anaerobic digester metagenome]|jgi:hypothetical protein|uniref:Uncharacterized protein n=1 Tax=anaerobic digester metagenome TaxID=1263854 RepID=A0A485LVD6_9ZZZZ
MTNFRTKKRLIKDQALKDLELLDGSLVRGGPAAVFSLLNYFMHVSKRGRLQVTETIGIL